LNRKTPLYQNPVFNFDFPDPTVIRSSDGYFYAYATQTVVNGSWINIQVSRSADLENWVRLGDALPAKPVWANQTQNFWAPHVSQIGNTYYMYYSADPNTLSGLCLAVATAINPAGPFTDKGTPLKCGSGFVNIDPMAYDDPQTGKHLLYWGSGFEPIKVQELAADRINFAANSQPTILYFLSTVPIRICIGIWSKARGSLTATVIIIYFSRRRLLHDRALRDYGGALDERHRTV
jgi:arabinan endo-1,5-alpha-L-arabinosidase